jgi:hypothetical protein
VLASCHCPDREFAIREKGGITPTLADEEESRGFLEEKGVSSSILVAFSSMIGPCDQTDSRNRHLSIEHALDLMVVPPLQGKGIEWLATVIAWLREVLLRADSSKLLVEIGRQFLTTPQGRVPPCRRLVELL